MITPKQFDEFIEKLQQRHGKGSYPAVFQDMLFNTLKNLPYEHVNFVINQAIAEHRFEPPLSKFKEYATEAIRRFHANHKPALVAAEIFNDAATPEQIKNLINMKFKKSPTEGA